LYILRRIAAAECSMTLDITAQLDVLD